VTGQSDTRPETLPWPVDLAFDRAARALVIRFEDDTVFTLPFELLRVESPSAEVQGHSAAQKSYPAGKSGVGVLDAEPVGRYGVKIRFDDGHDTGLYTWAWLYRLGDQQDALMAAYLEDLDARGLSR
jgi:DUF971 family protein